MAVRGNKLEIRRSGKLKTETMKIICVTCRIESGKQNNKEADFSLRVKRNQVLLLAWGKNTSNSGLSLYGDVFV